MANTFDPALNMNMSVYNDQTANRANAYLVAQMLHRALPYLVFEQFGTGYPVPMNSTKTVNFRRFLALDATPNVLTEGVTPVGKSVNFEDISTELKQYGDLITMTDVLLDTNDTNIMAQATQLVGEQAAQQIENMRIGVLLGGTNVVYSNGAARDAVNTPITLGLVRKVTRILKRQLASFITEPLASSPRFYTVSVSPCFVAVCHPDCEADIRNIQGFKDVVDYGTRTNFTNEIGSVEGVRFLFTTMMDSFADAGAAVAGADVYSTTGANADVYPILFIARDAYGIVPLKNASAITPNIINPTPSISDPLAQRAAISWKSMQTCVILNQAWLVRAEVAVTAY